MIVENYFKNVKTLVIGGYEECDAVDCNEGGSEDYCMHRGFVKCEKYVEPYGIVLLLTDSNR